MAYRYLSRLAAASFPSCYKSKSKKPIDIPDDIVIDILCRLSVEDVLKYRTVCKRWRILLSSTHFVQMHCRTRQVVVGEAPLLIVQNVTNGRYHIFNDHQVTKRTCSFEKMVLEASKGSICRASYNGLLVFTFNPTTYCVCNLITREQVTICVPSKLLKGLGAASLDRIELEFIFCGIFYHPQFREIILVFWKWYKYIVPSGEYEYVTYGISSKLWRFGSMFRYFPRRYDNSVIVSGRLYWMAGNNRWDWENRNVCAECIISCNMDIQDFRSMSHPGEACFDLVTISRHYIHNWFTLVNMNGFLGFGYSDHRYFTISIYVLEDYDNWCWAQKYKIDIRSVVKRILKPVRNDFFITAIVDSELIFYWWGQGLFGHHLIYKTTRKFPIPNQPKYVTGYHDMYCPYKVVSYIKSFIQIGGS